MLGGLCDYFIDDKTGQAPSFFVCAMDQEGQFNLSKLQRIVQDEHAAPAIREKVRNVVKNIIQLVPMLHLGKHLLEGLYYNERDLVMYSAGLLYFDGESKFKVTSIRARMTRSLAAGKLKRTELIRLLKEGGVTVKSDAVKALLVQKYLDMTQDSADAAEETAEKNKAEAGGRKSGDEIDGGVDEADEDDDGNDTGDLFEDDDDVGGVRVLANGQLEVGADWLAQEEQQAQDKVYSLFEIASSLSSSSNERDDAFGAIVDAISARAWSESNSSPMAHIKKRCRDFLLSAESRRESGRKDGEGGADMVVEEEAIKDVGKAIQRLARRDTISYTRLWFRSTLHWAGYELARPRIFHVLEEHFPRKDFEKENEGAYLKRVTNANKKVCGFMRYFENDLSCYHRVMRCVGDGNIEPLLNELPKLVAHLA